MVSWNHQSSSSLSPHSDQAEKTWVWRTEESELWFDLGTVVNVRVESEKWQDQAPKAPSKSAGSDAVQERAVPFSIEVRLVCS